MKLWDPTVSTGHREPSPSIPRQCQRRNLHSMWSQTPWSFETWDIITVIAGECGCWHRHIGKDHCILWVCCPATRDGPQTQRSEQQQRVWGQGGEEGSKFGEGLVIAISIASATEICSVSKRHWEISEEKGPSYSKSTTSLCQDKKSSWKFLYRQMPLD